MKKPTLVLGPRWPGGTTLTGAAGWAGDEVSRTRTSSRYFLTTTSNMGHTIFRCQITPYYSLSGYVDLDSQIPSP